MEFKIIAADQIATVIPLVKIMAKDNFSDAVLLQRFKEMTTQNYECVGVYVDQQLIAVAECGFAPVIILAGVLRWIMSA